MRSRLGILSGICILVLAFSRRARDGGVRINRIRFNPSGEDDGINASLNREIIRIENTGARAVRLGGWMIHTAEHLVFYSLASAWTQGEPYRSTAAKETIRGSTSIGT
jgi:hypothetical protein